MVDNKTLTITLAAPDASFLYNLRTVHVVPKAALEGKDLTNDPFFDAPIGAGPFKYVSWQSVAIGSPSATSTTTRKASHILMASPTA